MHYIDEAFLGPALMPADPLARSKVRMMTKLMDKCVHVACMTLTFATANREWLARMTPQEMKAELAKSPDRKRAEIKRQVITHGLDAPLVLDAIHQHQKLLDDIEAAIPSSEFILTDVGAAMRERMLAARRRNLADLLARWHPEQHPDVLALIDRLARALSTDLPAPQAT